MWKELQLHVDPALLGRREVHLYTIAFNILLSQKHACLSSLSREERIRAQSFRFKEDAERFVVGRGFLRYILGNYLDIQADSVMLQYGPYGKPELADRCIQFNVTHTRQYLGLAISAEGRVGLDIESSVPHQDMGQIAKRFWTPMEYCKLLSLPSTLREKAFLRCWTQKEAYIKAKGLGFSMPMNQFETAVLPEETCGMLWHALDSGEPSRWRFAEGGLPSAHLALAMEAPATEVIVACQPDIIMDGARR